VLAGEHAVTINPASPATEPGVASGPSRLPSDKYKLTLSYQDFLGNPAASVSVAKFTLEDRCTPGYYSSPYGEAPCVAAETGHYVPGPGATKETACAAGSYSSNLDAISCLPSPEGFYAPAGAANAIACMPGTHDPHTSSTSSAACEEDPPGSYSETGAAEATLCSPGRFAATSGNWACTLAEPGHYVQGYGADSQQPCPAGRYSAVTGAASCELAPIDSYALEGAVEATPCPTGTEASSEGQSECTPIKLTAGGGISTSSTPSLTPLTGKPIPLIVAPSITKLSINERRFRQLAHGPTVSYILSSGAALRYTLYRSAKSHPPASCQGSGAKCRTISSLSTGALPAGKHSASLASILRHGKGHRLAPGPYVLTVQAVGGSHPASVRFTVL